MLQVYSCMCNVTNKFSGVLDLGFSVFNYRFYRRFCSILTTVWQHFLSSEFQSDITQTCCCSIKRHELDPTPPPTSDLHVSAAFFLSEFRRKCIVFQLANYIDSAYNSIMLPF